MIGWLGRLFGTARSRGRDKPPIPDAERQSFAAWFVAQTRPAVALTPDASGAVGVAGSRLGGPAWLAQGEEWPTDAHGVPLEFVAQLDSADCRSLDHYPASGIIQFFVGRDEVYGVDFDDPARSTILVRRYDPSQPGRLTPPPPLEVVAGRPGSDYSPFQDEAARATGVALRPTPVTDLIDQNDMAVEQRLVALYDTYDAGALDAFLDSEAAARPARHHTGGYPAFTQKDVRYQPAFADHDHVLLRLTSDDVLMWGDVGECVFLIRSDDLKRGDFTRIAYSWDCH